MSEDKTTEVSLLTIDGGAAVEMFDEELKRIAENVLDLNAEPEGVRTITLTVRIKPDKSRQTAKVSLAVTSKPAPPRAEETTLFFGKTRGGEVVVTEYNQEQLDFDGRSEITNVEVVKLAKGINNE